MRAPDGEPGNPGLVDASNLADHAADLIERLRARRPRVHCITNAVAQNLTANVLLAAGAVPSWLPLPPAPTLCWSISEPSMRNGAPPPKP
jgi:hypothetical protein